MICKMFTINGKAPVISSIALTGSAIADPSVIMEYSAISNTPYYDGFSVRCPGVKNPNINYSDMCYYSTVKYDNPTLSQLTKAEFIPMSDMTEESHYLATTRSYVGGVTGRDGRLWFPRDTYWEHAGAYWIPTASYQNGPLYVYIWLPDIMNAPDNADEAGLDCTTLQTNLETCVNIYKCNMSSAMSNFSFNQTYCKEIVNFNAPSGEQYFGYGDIIKDYTSALNIDLVSASNIVQYQPLPAIKSAYDSNIQGAKTIDYVEGCTVTNLVNGYFNTDIKSAKNSVLNSVRFVSADGCNISFVDNMPSVTYSGTPSAYNSNINYYPDYLNGKFYINNCDAYFAASWTNDVSAENSRVSSVLSPEGPQGYQLKGTFKNCYYHCTANNTDWYLEDYPTVPATPL